MDERKLQALGFADGDLGKAMRIYEWLKDEPAPPVAESFVPVPGSAGDTNPYRTHGTGSATAPNDPSVQSYNTQQEMHEATSEAPGPDSEGGEGEPVTKPIPEHVMRAAEELGELITGDSTGGEEDGPLAGSSSSPATDPNGSTSHESGGTEPAAEDTSSSPSTHSCSSTPEATESVNASPCEQKGSSDFLSDGETDTPVQEGPTRFRESNWEDELKAAGRAARAQGKARWFNPYSDARGANAKASDLWLEGYDEQQASESANAVKEEA